MKSPRIWVTLVQEEDFLMNERESKGRRKTLLKKKMKRERGAKCPEIWTFGHMAFVQEHGDGMAFCWSCMGAHKEHSPFWWPCATTGSLEPAYLTGLHTISIKTHRMIKTQDRTHHESLTCTKNTHPSTKFGENVQMRHPHKNKHNI